MTACDLGEAALASLGAAARGGALGTLRTLRASRNASIGGGRARGAALRFLLEALPSLASPGLRSAASPRRLRARCSGRAAAASADGSGGGGGGVALEMARRR